MNSATILFAVGDPTARASLWKLWSRGPDAYLVAVSTVQSLKWSFHETGQCHIKLPTTDVMHLDPSVRWPVFDLWRHAPPGGPEESELLLQLITPARELRRIPVRERHARRVLWVPHLPEGGAVLVSLLLAQPGFVRGLIDGHRPELLHLIGELDLGARGSLSVVVSPVVEGITELVAYVDQRRTQIHPPGTRFRSGSLDHDDLATRVLIPLRSADDTRAFVDAARSSLAA